VIEFAGFCVAAVLAAGFLAAIAAMLGLKISDAIAAVIVRAWGRS
jgi:dolichol kinase